MAFLNRNIDLVIHQNNQDGLRTMAKFANLSTEMRLESFRKYTEELELKFHQGQRGPSYKVILVAIRPPYHRGAGESRIGS